ncbi:transcriptional regulator [Rhodococcus erythropolis]|uniref:sigma-54-dependent Fis family transcriptional regulator n=1 Tax=Rhodococcus erythropolis TaxID=1833 RepID=UPI001E634FA3|nr:MULTISPECIES: helix-turn-helix domain-containing protein [Rhodococcus erythropolis group]MCD2108542.1 transcriptional regulator [Rhodococcus qingshengii]MCZ4527433.1 transcriptional regulator [Rhodococcus erythropolis]
MEDAMMGIVDDTDGDGRKRVSPGNRDARLGGTDEFVAASWLRSQAAGVSPEGGDIRYIGDVDVASRLVHYAQPVLEKLIEYTEDVPLSVAVSDNKGRVLSRLDTNSTIGALVDTISLAPGFSYAESEVGTNGVGTVLESGRSVHIVGAAHFHERFQKYSCSGAPIRDPLSGHIEGVLDLTCLVEHSTPLLHSFVRSAASTIETALLNDRELNQRILFNAFSKMEAKSRSPLLVAGKNVLISTSKAQKLLDAAEQRIIVQHALYLAERATKATEEIELSPQRIVKIRTTRISSGKSVVGVGVSILDLTTLDVTVRETVAVTVPQFNVVNDSSMCAGRNSVSEPCTELSSVWKSVTSSVRDVVERKESVTLIGERGVGKEKLIRDMVREVHPDVTFIGIEPGFLANDVKTCASSDGSRTVYLILRHPERLTADEILLIKEVLSELNSQENLVGVAAIVTEAESSGSKENHFHQSFRGIFGRSIQVPPLRHRTNDLPYLARHTLSEISGNGVSEISSDALEKLSAYSWPGNITELRNVLSKCLSKKPSGMIEMEDLPTSICLSSIHASGILEHVEREAIVKSLEENDGNRMRAAKSLGIARSSLYRKMKMYKI